MFLGVCYQKSSYKYGYVSDFGRGQSYGRLKFKTDGKEYSKLIYQKNKA
jgi:hypothetical protein